MNFGNGIFLAICALISLSDASGQSLPKALTCSFANGSSVSFDTDWNMQQIRDRLDFTVAAIDLANGKAQLIGNLGASDVFATLANSTLHLLEVTPTGNQTLTTICFLRPRMERYPPYIRGM